MKLGIVGVVSGGFAMLIACVSAQAQMNQTQRIAAKSGETIELLPISAWANCRSTLIAPPEVEVMQGPPEITVTAREQMVTMPALACPNKLKGAMLIVTVGQVKQPIEGKLTFRVKFKTKGGERQNAWNYNYSLFP